MTVQNDRARGGKALSADPNKWPAVGVGLMVLLTPLCMFGLIAASVPEPPEHPMAAIATAIGVEPSELIIGSIVYRNSCALCHAKDAAGVPHLGKPLRNSEFVQTHSNDQLFTLIAQGRLPTDPANTTGAAMPPRANAALPDEDIRAVVAHLRSLQDSSQPFATLDDWMMPQSGGSIVGGEAGIGHDAFVASCSACHGVQGEGREGLGKALRGSEFIATQSDEQLIAFVKSGRPSWDESNTTGLDMPPKGGNPAITDDQLKQIVSYIRALHAADTGE